MDTKSNRHNVYKYKGKHHQQCEDQTRGIPKYITLTNRSTTII